jgi:hypothetical protein
METLSARPINWAGMYQKVPKADSDLNRHQIG